MAKGEFITDEHGDVLEITECTNELLCKPEDECWHCDAVREQAESEGLNPETGRPIGEEESPPPMSPWLEQAIRDQVDEWQKEEAVA